MVVDSQDCAGVFSRFPEQIREAARLDIPSVSGFSQIFWCGLGGSGWPGDVVKAALEIPVTVVRDYVLPAYVGEGSLVIVCSYSGNTEEALAMYDDARKRNVQMVVVASGGTLVEKANADGVPLITFPSGLQPRMAYGYQTIPVLRMLADAGVVDAVDWNTFADFLDSELEDVKKKAVLFGERIGDGVPLIYSSSQFYTAAYKWKINFNENAKIHAFSNAVPEMNHNEMNAFVGEDGEYTVFFLRDKNDDVRIGRRMDVLHELISVRKVGVANIVSKGNSFVERLFWMMWLGDWVSYYVAIARGVDPTPVDFIEMFKKRLK
jgi:glucose/mannose-6-phosphate isomerase